MITIQNSQLLRITSHISSVSVIIWLMQSKMPGPKVIIISGLFCIQFDTLKIIVQTTKYFSNLNSSIEKLVSILGSQLPLLNVEGCK